MKEPRKIRSNLILVHLRVVKFQEFYCNFLFKEAKGDFYYNAANINIVLKRKMYENQFCSSTFTQHIKALANVFRPENKIVNTDILNSLVSVYIKHYSLMLTTIFILSLILFLKFINKKSFENSIFSVYEMIIQKSDIKISGSRIIKISYYIFLVLFMSIYLNSIKIEIVVEDKRKPIRSLRDLLEPENDEIRPLFPNYFHTQESC